MEQIPNRRHYDRHTVLLQIETSVGRAWKPDDIKDGAILQRLLAHMQAADRGLKRLSAALDKTGSEPLATILRSFSVATLERVNNLEILEKIVLALELKAGSGA